MVGHFTHVPARSSGTDLLADNAGAARRAWPVRLVPERTVTVLDVLKTLPEAWDAARAGGGKSGKSSAKEPPRFAAQGRRPAAALTVEVDGFGALSLPLAAEQAAALQRASRPARFGRREKTLLDTAVRHSDSSGSPKTARSSTGGVFDVLNTSACCARSRPRGTPSNATPAGYS